MSVSRLMVSAPWQRAAWDRRQVHPELPIEGDGSLDGRRKTDDELLVTGLWEPYYKDQFSVHA
jgi:hypothetical protein